MGRVFGGEVHPFSECKLSMVMLMTRQDDDVTLK